MLLLWQPGDTPRAAPGAAFILPPGDELIVRIRYRKTWEYERKVMTDRSTIGLYVARPALPPVERLDVTLPGGVLDRDLRVLAVTPDAVTAGVDLRLEAIRPDGRRSTLLALRPIAGWTRRYWLEAPVVLPRGTRLGVSASTVLEPRPTLTLDVVSE